MANPIPKSNEALALLWAYELHRENMQMFKGLKKINRHLNASRKTPSANCANDASRQSGTAEQQPKS
ncbi:hypothetical protein N7457_007569 [Penicillium paradoxum]|uniref:uncharacterized protein n=1 Tax=Penicillium paradoxum TaxID=176176 RepID=UPI002547F824|nr:uncharacterized protein N7457_007569 [Penicillium paradoxum]KAJ5779849.1 hypothetical protein N7457_007569 [Penicillium paradoxum]